MEELSQYRSRIGIFAAIYCRKSFAGKGRKRQKRSRSPSVLKRKLIKAKNKPKDTANIPQKAGDCLKYERRPCRLGYLLLLLIVAVTCLSERPKYFLSVSHDTLKDRSWIVNNQVNNSNSICIRKLHWQQRNVQFEKLSSSSHWRYFETYGETKIWTPAIPTVNVLSFIHKRYRLFQTPKHDFAPTETSHNASVSDTRSLDDNHISSTYVNHAIEILNCDKGGTLQNFTSNDYSTTICSNLCMKCHIIIILICLELLLCLGTCYYLLGNKGSHSYHGNPVGDAWLNKKTLALIEENAHESIGAICIKTFPHGEKYEPFRNYGTGFRAGDKYFITAYHVLKEKIECSILEVCMQIDNEDKRCAVHRILSQKLGETVDDTLDISKIVKKYIVHTHTNVPLLLETLKDVLDIDNLSKQMNQTWKQRCEVDFVNHGKFFLDWKIVFGDADGDIVVVKLTESSTGQSFPRPLLLDEKLRLLNDIHIIRYKFDDTPVVGIDQIVQTFNTDVDLQNKVDAAIQWWNDKYPNMEENYFHTCYESCRKVYDEETGKVVFQASYSFHHGASGSPIVYFINGQPLVAMIYQKGFPEFYYTDIHEDPRYRQFGDIQVDSDICLFMGGTAMKQLSKLLDRVGNKALKRNLFFQPENIETRVVGGEGIRTPMKEENIPILVNGKIELEQVDVIVCEVDSSLHLAACGTVAKDLLAVGGETLITECKTKFPNGIKHGEVVAIDGGKLKCEKLYLLSLPVVRDEKKKKDKHQVTGVKKILRKTFSSIVNKAIEENVKSLAIPAIGISTLNISADDVASVMFDTFREDLIGEILVKIVLFDKTTMQAFMHVGRRYQSDYREHKMHSVDINKLNWMIEKATARVEYETSQNLYVRTKVYDKAEEILKESNILVITGNSGDGKTALAFQMMKSLCRVDDNINRGLRPLVLSEGNQFDELVKPNNFLCVLIDDMFDLVKFSPWNIHLAFQNSKSNKLIMTQRKDILNAFPHSTKETPLFSDNKILDLSSNHFKTREAVRALLDAYLPESEDFTAFSNQELDEIMKSSSYIGFPQCCKLAKKNKELKSRRKDFFQHPVEFLQREFQNMTEDVEKICRYVSLVFLLFNPLYLTSETQNQKANDLIDFFKEVYGYQLEGKEKLLRSLRAMIGLYTKYDDDMKLSFSHDSILTSFAFNFGTKHIREFIQYADASQLSLLVTDNIETQITGSVKVPKSAVSYLIKRVNELLMTRKEEIFQYISNMQVWDDHTFVLNMIENQGISSLLISHVDERSRSILVYFAERGKQMPVKNIIELILHDTTYKDQINLALNAACVSGNEEIVLLLLRTDPEPHIYYFYNAVKGGNIKILFLLNAAFPTTIQNERAMEEEYVGSTVLHFATRNGQVQICQYIANIFPNLINIRRNDGAHILHEAAWSGNITCLEKIIDIVLENHDPTQRQQYMMECLDNDGSTIFHFASRNGQIQMCQYIAKTYPKLINIKGNDGRYILHEAASSGSIPCLETITDIVVGNQNPTQRQQYMMQCLNNKGLTILHLASRNGQVQMCQYIADTYPKLINIRSNNEIHILHHAAWSGSISCLEAITDIVVGNQDPAQRQQYMMQCLNNVGLTILHFASRNGQEQMCQYIAKTYPKLINIRSNNEMHILHSAAASGSIPCLETITDIVVENQDPKQRQQYMMQCLSNVGSTIFHFASGNGQIQMCQYIAKTYPKLIDIRRNDGVHVLHVAAGSGSIPCLEAITDIVVENQDPKQRQQYMMQCLNNVGLTILHFASLSGQAQMCQYIAKTYPKLINIKRDNGSQILHEAAWSGSIPCLETVTDIVVEDQNPKQRQRYMKKCLNNVGSTIFHCASRSGQVHMCQYIAKTYPKLINIRRYDGVHVLHEAALSGSVPCLEILTDIVVENQDPSQRQKYMMKCLNNVGSTILHFATSNGQLQMCQYIAKTYPKLINIRNNNEMHILHSAAASGSIPCLETITDIVVGNQDPTQRQQYMMQCLDNDGASILHFAHKNEQFKICQYINDTYPNLKRKMTSQQKCDLM